MLLPRRRCARYRPQRARPGSYTDSSCRAIAGTSESRSGWTTFRYCMKRRAYRAHAHANARIDAMTLASGLRPCAEAFTLVWRVVLYARDDLEAVLGLVDGVPGGADRPSSRRRASPGQRRTSASIFVTTCRRRPDPPLYPRECSGDVSPPPLASGRAVPLPGRRADAVSPARARPLRRALLPLRPRQWRRPHPLARGPGTLPGPPAWPV